MTAAEAKAALAPWLAARGILLDDGQWERLAAYLRDLLEASQRANLTADTDEATLWRRHIADGLAALPALRPRLPARPRLLDLGAGAGFIGFSIKVAWPEASVTLQEASYKKFQFLNLAAARLGFPGLRVLWRRAGTTVPAERFDAVLERAVAPLHQAAALALPSVAPGGRLVAWKSTPASPQDAALKAALQKESARIEENVAYSLPGEDRQRFLVILHKDTGPVQGPSGCDLQPMKEDPRNSAGVFGGKAPHRGGT